jgi:hypothetical protein
LLTIRNVLLRQHPETEEETMDALTAIFSRRSVRIYTTKPVPHDTVTDLVRAAMYAPSAGNERPWRYRPYGPRTSRRDPEVSSLCRDAEARVRGSACLRRHRPRKK